MVAPRILETISSLENFIRESITPSVLYRPSISIDGNQWCALYGENLLDGVVGFGDSPAEAMAAFDKEWAKKLGTKGTPHA